MKPVLLRVKKKHKNKQTKKPTAINQVIPYYHRTFYSLTKVLNEMRTVEGEVIKTNTCAHTHTHTTRQIKTSRKDLV